MSLGTRIPAPIEIRQTASRSARLTVRVVVFAGLVVAAFPMEARAQLVDFTPIINAVNTAISAATAARNAAEEVRNNMRTSVAALTDELRGLMEDASDEARRILAEEVEGRDQFLPGGQCATACAAFRADLLELLDRTEELSGAVVNAAGLDAQPDFAAVSAAVRTLPGKSLYPIYRVSQGLLASNLPEHLATGVGHVNVLRETVLNSPASLPDSCQVVMSRAEGVERAAYGVTATASIVKLVAMVFKVVGRTEFEGYAAGWGWVGGTIKGNKPMKIGDVLTGISDAMFKMSTYAHNKLRLCTTLAFQAETSAALGAIGATLSGLNFDLANVDAPVSSRATQASVDALGSSISSMHADVRTLVEAQGAGSLDVRIQIERALASPSTPDMGVFYLPESFGGLLESVRRVVEENIAQHEAAGLGGSEAWTLLSRGDAAFGQAAYKQSYALYQAAYRQLSSGRSR